MQSHQSGTGDNTTQLVFERGRVPYLDFMAKLTAPALRPRTNLTRFHGVLATDSQYQERVTPVNDRKFKKTAAEVEPDGLEEPDLTVGKRKGRCWAKRLKRVSNIEVSICSACGGPMKIVASIEDAICNRQNIVAPGNQKPRPSISKPRSWSTQRRQGFPSTARTTEAWLEDGRSIMHTEEAVAECLRYLFGSSKSINS